MGYDSVSEKRKRALADSLKKLMGQKPFSKITVNDIVQDCGVNRKTFYYHFEDIYTLLKWMLEREAIEVVKHFDLLVNTEDALTFVIDYVDANRHILSCAYDSIGREEMRRFFYADFIHVVSSVIDRAEDALGVRVGEDFKRFLADFYAEAMAGNLISMFHGELPYTRETIVSNLLLILKSSVPDTLLAKAREGERTAPAASPAAQAHRPPFTP